MQAIFIGGFMDGRVVDIKDSPARLFVCVPNDEPLTECSVEPCFKQVVYERTMSSDAAPVYIESGGQHA